MAAAVVAGQSSEPMEAAAMAVQVLQLQALFLAAVVLAEALMYP